MVRLQAISQHTFDQAKQANKMNKRDKEESSPDPKSPQNRRRARIYRQASSPLQERAQNQVRWSWREIGENTFKEIRRTG
jgi:hypothetical protein